MNIILVTKRGRNPFNINFSSPLGFATVMLSGLLMIALLMGAGYYWGANKDPAEYVKAWKGELSMQRKELAQLQASSRADIDALTANLGQMSGYLTRLDALGSRLVKMAKIEESEFNFTSPPALGGPAEQQEVVSTMDVTSLETAIQDVNIQLTEKEQQLTVLEEILRNQNLQEEVYPAGRPVEKGWVSSNFGYRNSPFGNNAREYHKGIDIAHKDGSPVSAVAGGVVTWAGKRFGYGNLVEINHGNGYITRYGHGSKILINEGEAVKKGQVVALMGSTGRSTGPHVHFEVLKNGQQIDPIKFVQDSQ